MQEAKKQICKPEIISETLDITFFALNYISWHIGTEKQLLPRFFIPSTQQAPIAHSYISVGLHLYKREPTLAQP